MSERSCRPVLSIVAVVGLLIEAVLVSCTLMENPMEAGGASEYFDTGGDYPVSISGEEYASLPENPFFAVDEQPLSTFSVDVDVASYANCRRFISYGQLPPPDAVRIEEFVNYFDYSYPQPEEGALGVSVAITECPWNRNRMVARIGLKAKEIQEEIAAPSYLTFLIDVSGSMSDENKLPLLKEAFKLLVEQLDADDRVAIVVYASQTGCVLPPTSGAEKMTIISAIDRLTSGGSTAGAAGIQLAYQMAEEQYDKSANNRVILATDGDFNVGVSSDEALVNLIEEKRGKGIYLTVLGFGMGNYKDAKMEGLADHGNGNYAYIDSRTEAEKVFVHDLVGYITVIANDVKIQVAFNSATVKAYRLIGYENRVLDEEDFTDSTKDAGEMGAGQTVTAFYELIPASSDEPVPQHPESIASYLEKKQSDISVGRYLQVNIRYISPDDGTEKTFAKEAGDDCFTGQPDSELRFALAVVEYGLLLKESEYRGNATFNQVASLASEAVDADENGYRKEFIDLVEKASVIDK
ncbi:MAG: VWA domain-containing protein [Chitinispirillaceae bacterium]|nr:VWA domain-containing protein [Chitinispirillaceae bacterium]